MSFVALAGRRFGKWLVLGIGGRAKGSAQMWKCVCDCGTSREVRVYMLLDGRSSSCGCGRFITRATMHRMSKTVEYRCWSLMKSRCVNSKHAQYANYGGRGIKVCPSWAGSFLAFYKDMGPKPPGRYSLDRIDVNGDYEPSNCRWATSLEQANNTRANNYVKYLGQRVSISQAARLAGGIVDGTKAAVRIRKLGWTIQRAVETPTRKQAQQ